MGINQMNKMNHIQTGRRTVVVGGVKSQKICKFLIQRKSDEPDKSNESYEDDVLG